MLKKQGCCPKSTKRKPRLRWSQERMAKGVEDLNQGRSANLTSEAIGRARATIIDPGLFLSGVRAMGSLEKNLNSAGGANTETVANSTPGFSINSDLNLSEVMDVGNFENADTTQGAGTRSRTAKRGKAAATFIKKSSKTENKKDNGIP